MEGERREAAASPKPSTFPLNRTLRLLTLSLGWLLFVVTGVIALALASQIQKLQLRVQSLSVEAMQLQSSLVAARKVLLERANRELGYADVDLRVGNRYQFRFRLQEADQWLRDVLPLLSPVGQRRVNDVRDKLRHLSGLIDKDRVKAQNLLDQAREILSQTIVAEMKR